MLSVRDEGPDDVTAIRAVVARAFGRDAEADLIDLLRRASAATVSLVAVQPAADARRPVDTVIGHILFSPITVDGTPSARAVGLAPLAVGPAHQRRGAGTALVEAGLARCRRLNVNLVVVLGHPQYYPRFGFQPGHQLGLTCEYDVPPEVFMALELTPGRLASVSGVARYHAAFAQLRDRGHLVACSVRGGFLRRLSGQAQRGGSEWVVTE